MFAPAVLTAGVCLAALASVPASAQALSGGAAEAATACTPKAEAMTESLVVCSKCGAINRLLPSRPAIGAKCGKCGAKVFAGHPEDVTAEIFDRQIARSTIPVLVDFWAPWCGPCRMMAPAYEAAARELEPEVRLIKLNSDAQQAVASRLGIQGIPTMILFLEGREVARRSGAMSVTQIVHWVRDRLPTVAV